jgi:cytochrome P450
VIKEALRIHPAVGFQLERIAPVGGITIRQTYLPEGTILGMNAWVLHRDKQVFGVDVEAFRPERWLEAGDEELKMMNRSFFAVRSYHRQIIVAVSDQFTNWCLDIVWSRFENLLG